MSQAVISRPASQIGIKQPGIPNLPQIEHPLSRLGNPEKLNVRGLSSRQGRPASNSAPRAATEVPFSSLTPRVSRSAAGRGNEEGRKSLPRIPQPFQSIPEGVPVSQSDDPSKTRLPVFGARAELGSRAESRISMTSVSQSNRPGTQTRLEVDELEMMLRERIKKYYFELRKLFIANDPEGRGHVTKEALARIIITFLGRFVSLKNFNELMNRIHFAERQIVSLEDFYGAFRQPGSIEAMPEWMDPVNRGDDKKAMTASQVHVHLKEKAKERFLDIGGMIPQMNPGGSGRILKPEFRNTLNKLSFFMDDYEFDKLWSRYDPEGHGVIQGERLMNKLGISLRGGSVHNTTRPPPPGSPPSSPREHVSPRRSPRKADIERTKSLDVERWLRDKFRTGCAKMKKEFELHDKEMKGEVPLDKFQFVLAKFGLKLDNKELDNFLTRCSLPVRARTKVSYRDFLQRFQDRSANSITHQILANPQHKFNDNRSGSPDSKTVASASAAEAKLMKLFQTDFLELLATFQTIDKLGERVISQQEFRAAIESRFHLNLSDIEFNEFIDSVPLDAEGNVKYQDFMAQFDSKYAPSLFDAKSLYNPSRPERNDDMEIDEPMDFEEFNKRHRRTTAEVSHVIKGLVNAQLAHVAEVFHELDETNSGMMSQEIMYQLFKKLKVHPEITRGEIRRIWGSFITTQKNYLQFTEFIRHFGYNVQSAAFPNAKYSPPKRGDSDFMIRSRKLNCASDMLEDNLRSKVDYRWDDLRLEFMELDKFGTGYISKEEFSDVLQELCVHLNQNEREMLCKKFDKNGDGRVSYVEFLRPFAMRKQTYKYGNNMLGLLTHPQSEIPIAPIVNEPQKGLTGITARLRQELVGNWRNLRRTFKKMDPANTGLLSVPEFRKVLSLCNVLLDENEVYHVMAEYDEKIDGKISYKKFLRDMDDSS